MTDLIKATADWWHRATHAPCPVCGTDLHVGREWHDHKATHGREEWLQALERAKGESR